MALPNYRGPEEKYGANALLAYQYGGGYLPGQRERLEADASRQLGARTNIERALAGERIAATPGAKGTAFADQTYNQLVQGQQRALMDYLSQINEAGLGRQFQASQLLFGEEQAYNQRRFQEKMGKKAMIGNIVGGLLGAGGQIAGGAIAASSKDFKKNIKSANTKSLLNALREVDVKKFQYKSEMGMGGKEHVGVLAEEAPMEMKAGSKAINLPDAVGMIIAAIQSLADRMDRFAPEEAEEIESEEMPPGNGRMKLQQALASQKMTPEAQLA